MTRDISRSYCFTGYGDEPKFDDQKIRYLVYQREKGEKSGKEHWQGYVEFYKSHRIAGAQKALKIGKNNHFSVREGTRIEARNYCLKSKSKIGNSKEFGIWLKGQGHRSDLDKLVLEIEEGRTDYELLKDDAIGS